MTPEQCQKLREAIPRSFPAIQTWWDRLKDTETREAMTRRNTACLIDCDYDDCTAVIRDMLRSDVDPWPYDADKERSAAIIAKAANERRRERKERERGPQSLVPAGPYARPRGVMSIWEQADKLAKYRASQEWTKDGDDDLIAEMMGPEELNDKKSWVSCRECRDTGTIIVLKAIRWVRPWRGEGEPFLVHSTAAAACSCASGDPWRKRKLPLPDFDKLVHIKLPPGATSKQAGALLTEWQRTTAAAKRFSGFDAYNERAESRSAKFA
jgi:hypothetical protein